MKALVTGGAGFIGSHLSEELLSRGTSVVALDDLSTGSLSNIGHLHDDPKFSFHQGNILNAPELDHLMAEANIVYHLAAAVGVRYVLENPVTSLETNVQGTEAILRLARKHGGKKVILASSSEVYGKLAQIPFREDSDCLLGPTSVSRWGYAISKTFDELLALGYHHQYGLPVVILRFFNTVGPRQTGRYGMVMPRFVSQALAGDPITVYGDGQHKRSFTYVKDVVKAVADISDVPSAEGQVFNIGSNKETSILNLAELIRTVLNSGSEIALVPFREVYGTNFEEAERRLPDISKLKNFIEYHPNTDLQLIVRQIADSLTDHSPIYTKGSGGIDDSPA